jgi:hypothetical protein
MRLVNLQSTKEHGMNDEPQPGTVAAARSHPISWVVALVGALLVAGAIAAAGVSSVAAAGPSASPGAAATDNGGTNGRTNGGTNGGSHVCPDKATDSSAGASTMPSS